MNILLISYGDFDYDGRLRELYKVFDDLGTLFALTRGSSAKGLHHKTYNGNYVNFIAKTLAYGKSIKSVDVLVLDNRKAVLPGLILKRMLKPRIMIQDCRELYISTDVKHFAGRIGCLIERQGIKRSDIIICANKERSEYMQSMFCLKELPLVYENLRELKYSDETEENKQRVKFARYIRDDEIRIISTSGCSVSRTNDVLVENLDKVSYKCRLFLVGASTVADEKAIQTMIDKKKLDNVEIMGQLNQDELTYLISASHIGIVNYHQNDVNNKYCASGKIYEFAYGGLPVVTTTNPPLERMCLQEHIGCADDEYWRGINQVIENMAKYRSNVAAFALSHPVVENNAHLRRTLLRRLEENMNGETYE